MASDPNQAHEFVNKLATDDDFRQKVEADPSAAFAEHGMQPHPDDLGGGASLPSKEEISQNIDAIKNHVHPGVLGIPIFRHDTALGGVHYIERATAGGVHYADKAVQGGVHFADRSGDND